MKWLAVLLLSTLLAPTAQPPPPSEPPPAEKPKPKKAKLTDKQIKKILIKESIADYPGNCPCPYNRASNGSRCGKRSAYSRDGGYAPLCYERDVTAEMVAAYRAANE